MQTNHRKLWKSPWRYKEGVVISLGLFILGLAFEWVFYPQYIKAPSWPLNIVLFTILPLFLILISLFFKKNALIQWLQQVPAAISSIILYTFVVLLMGFIPQTDEVVPTIIQKLGLTHITSSYIMILAHTFLLTTLGMVAIKRLRPFKGKNIGFFLNHVGLWIILAAGFLGVGDFYRLSVPLVEGEVPTHLAYDAKTGEKFRIPIFLQLIDFDIEEYNPQIFWLDSSYSVIENNEQKSSIQIEEGKEFTYSNWKFKVLEYFPLAVRDKENKSYISDSTAGSCPAANILAYNLVTHDTIKAWVCSGSFVMRSYAITLEKNLKLSIGRPLAKAFRSRIAYTYKDNKSDTVLVEVNKPVTIGAWKIYQQSYDSEKGRWSDLSVVEVITDPWLPAVYLGIFMVLAGAIYIFWIGRGTSTKQILKSEENE
jgi:hypothetical protein